MRETCLRTPKIEILHMSSTTLSEGIVTQVVPFKDYDQIVTVFTPQHGLIKVFVKNAARRGRQNNKSCTPLTRVELSWTEGKGEMGKCEEVVPSAIMLR